MKAFWGFLILFFSCFSCKPNRFQLVSMRKKDQLSSQCYHESRHPKIFSLPECWLGSEPRAGGCSGSCHCSAASNHVLSLALLRESISSPTCSYSPLRQPCLNVTVPGEWVTAGFLQGAALLNRGGQTGDLQHPEHRWLGLGQGHRPYSCQGWGTPLWKPRVGVTSVGSLDLSLKSILHLSPREQRGPKQLLTCSGFVHLLFFFPTNLNLTFMKIKLIILHLCSQRKFDLNVTHKVVAQKGAVCQMDSSVC